LGIKIKEPSFNSSIDSIDNEDNPSVVSKMPEEIYKPISYWNETMNELMKMKEVEVGLPVKENESFKNIFGVKDVVPKSKHIFAVFNVKQMSLESNENVNKTEEPLIEEPYNMFLETKPNSNDTDGQNIAI
jgi:hypothetical protein